MKAYTGARTVLEKEDLEERGALNLEDALRRVPGVQVLDETGTGILPNIGVRGLNPLRTNVCKFWWMVTRLPLALTPTWACRYFPLHCPALKL